jgi:hypothetical protein
VVIESPLVRLRFISDRGQYFVDVAPMARAGGWYDLAELLKAAGVRRGDEDQHSARRIRCEDAARPEHLCHAFEEARLASSAARLATPPVKA